MIKRLSFRTAFFIFLNAIFSFLTLHDSQFFSNFRKRFNRFIQMRWIMRSGNLHANSRQPFRNNRIKKSNHINSFFQKCIGHLLCQHSIIQHHRNNGMLTGLNVEARRRHFRTEILCIRLELVAKCRGFTQHVDDSNGCTHNRR